MSGIRLVIAGSRGLEPTFDEITDALYDCELMAKDIGVVLCGGAKGADECGASWAEMNKIVVEYYPAQWQKLGKLAGLVRNATMAEECDAGLLFWDGLSPGTANMVAQLACRRKPLWVVRMEKSRKEPSRIILPKGP